VHSQVVITRCNPELVWRYIASPSTWNSWLPSSLNAYLKSEDALSDPQQGSRCILQAGDALVEEFGLPPAVRLGAVTWAVGASGPKSANEHEVVLTSDGIVGFFEDVRLRMVSSPAREGPGLAEDTALRVSLSWASASQGLALVSQWMLRPASLLDLSIGLLLLQWRLKGLGGSEASEKDALAHPAVGLFTPDVRRVLKRADAQRTYNVLASTVYGLCPSST
jgi:hypothetical protein